MHLLLEEFKHFSQVILKYTIIMSHSKSYIGSLIVGLVSESESHTKKNKDSASLIVTASPCLLKR